MSEVKGKVTHVLEPITGTSQKGEWKKQTFVILEDKEQFPKSIAIDTFNKEPMKVGEFVNVSINIESSEYNGKWYTNLTMWKYEVIGQSMSVKADDKQMTDTTKVNEPMQAPDDLPF